MVYIHGTNYCGLFSSVSGFPLSELDAECKEHDFSDDYQVTGGTKYLVHQPADDDFLDNTKNIRGFKAKVARSFFHVKKAIAPHKRRKPPQSQKRSREVYLGTNWQNEPRYKKRKRTGKFAIRHKKRFKKSTFRKKRRKKRKKRSFR